MINTERSCDHPTTRRTVITRRGSRQRQMIRTDNHITVFCGASSNANRQGHVYVFVERNGQWRIMRNSERRDRNGSGIELYRFP
jgi:hypothetical protein